MSKITIPTHTWIQLYAELANWHVEESAIDNPCQEDEHGNLSYTEEAQDKFNHASGCVEEILESFFEKVDSEAGIRNQKPPETPQYWISKSNGGYWDVMFGEERVMSCRAKSRSKVEMQNLLDHFNAKFEEKILERFFEREEI